MYQLLLVDRNFFPSDERKREGERAGAEIEREYERGFVPGGR